MGKDSNSIFTRKKRLINGLKLAIASSSVTLIVMVFLFVDSTTYSLYSSCMGNCLGLFELLSDTWLHVMILLVFVIALCIGYSYKNEKDWKESKGLGDE